MIKHIMLAILLVGIVVGQSKANTPTYADKTAYIHQYSAIAIAEMYRSGIPASITLAQAILESGWGLGELAVGSNNYFGIKCKSDWTGGTYYKEDDDLDAHGRLIKSCFRSYATVGDSFIDHTDFLMNRPYYTACFDHDSDEYLEWAVALQAAGYATAKDYALRLVDVIENYQLHRYDKANATTNLIAENHLISPVVRPTIEMTYTDDVVVDASAGNLVPPPVENIENYRPKWMEPKMDTRTGVEKSQAIANSEQANSTNTPAPKTNSVYKSHTRVMPYRPAASNGKRR